MKKVFWTVGFLGLLACLYVVTGAQTVTGSLYVRGEVPDENWVSLTFLSFSSLSHSSVTHASSTIEVRIANGVPYYISLDAGQFLSGTRRLKHETELTHVSYFLFQDSAEQIEWGDNLYAGTYPSGEAMGPLTGTGAAQVHNVYGRALGYGTAAPGSYADNVLVTVHY